MLDKDWVTPPLSSALALPLDSGINQYSLFSQGNSRPRRCILAPQNRVTF